MKKFTRIVAMLLTVLMLSSSLVSCEAIQGIIGSITGTEQDGPGTITPPHFCESKCDVCGKCTDKSCTMAICRSKCEGHSQTPVHSCESVCGQCGKCLDKNCTESACTDKCQGHLPPHKCESECRFCGKCTDVLCKEDVCAVKCEGHDEELSKAYGYLPIISETMPAIYINTPDESNEWVIQYDRQDKLDGKIDYVDATISTGNCDDEYKITDYKAEVKVRGNYTLQYPKKPIRIKFKKDAKTNLFGLHDGEEYRNWVLLADWKDLSMSNNTVAFYLGNTILGSDGYYCTDFRNVEVYLNGEYWGVYLLVEQQEVKDNRTSLPEVEDDYKGTDIGYFFEYDGYYYLETEANGGDPTFEMTYPSGAIYRTDWDNNNKPIGYTVKSDIYDDAQLQFIKNYMDKAFYIAFEATKGNFYKFNADYTDVVADSEATDAKAVISAVMDLQSLVDIYILNEIACDLDVDWSSFYMSVDMTAEGNKKIVFEAPWDWDSCFGLRGNIVPNGQGMYASTKNNPWLRLFTGQDWYWQMVKAKWAEMKEYNLLENTIELVKTEKETYKDYYISNYTKWSQRVTNGNNECNSTLNSYRDVQTAQGLAADFLIDWLTKRFAYLDSQWYSYTAEYPEAYGYLPIISETMPAIYINTPDESNEWVIQYDRQDKIDGKIDYVDATISTGNCDDEYKITDYKAEVKVRGNYTLKYPKKPIRIKFKKDAKTNLFGLHDGEEYRNWVLLADWKDLSMSNNTVAFYLGNTILGSDGYYCTDFRNVEVYLNGEYWGVYLLVEQQEVKDNRTSLPEVEDDYKGTDIGYFFEYDGYYYLETEANGGDPTFEMTYPSGAIYRTDRNNNNKPIGYTVKSDIYDDAQLQFIKNYMDKAFYIAFEATKGNFYKFNADYTDVVAAPEIKNAKDAVANVMDIQSLVDIYILNEIACDLDVDWSSFYMSVDMTAEGNKKIVFEAPWDWDSCFGLRGNIVPNGQGMYASTKNNPWFRLFTGQDWYWQMVKAKWADIVDHDILNKTIELVKTEKETYKDYYISNYTKWSQRVTNGEGECNSTLNSFRDVQTAQGLAADFLIDWLTKRFSYLDEQWGKGEFGKVKIEVDENLPENSTVYRYEAEHSSVVGAAIREGEDRAYASNSSYIGQVGASTRLTFTLTSEADTIAYLFAGISKRTDARDFNSMFTVTVNGATVLIPERTIPALSNGEEDWHTFVSVKLAPIQLIEGENTIVISCLGGNATNFDYIEIYSSEGLEW